MSDGVILPLTYRFEINERFTEKYYSKKNIVKPTIKIDEKDGVTIDLYDLQPVGNLTDVNCADTVLCFQRFNILSCVVLNIRTQNEKIEVVL